MIADGRALAETVLNRLEKIHSGRGKRVCFLSFNPTYESSSFIKVKSRVARRLGLITETREESGLSTAEAITRINKASQEGFDGIVVQLPLGVSMDTEEVLNSIPKKLDIDLLGRESQRAYTERRTQRMPPVAGAIEEILKVYNVSLEGRDIVILGKGRLVGEPAAMLFERLRHGYKTFDISNEKSEIEDAIHDADIIISGMGVPHYIKPDIIKEGVVLIDAGTSESEGKLAGDVDPACLAKSALLTPVPGGIGPLTVALLFSNLFKE